MQEELVLKRDIAVALIRSGAPVDQVAYLTKRVVKDLLKVEKEDLDAFDESMLDMTTQMVTSFEFYHHSLDVVMKYEPWIIYSLATYFQNQTDLADLLGLGLDLNIPVNHLKDIIKEKLKTHPSLYFIRYEWANELSIYIQRAKEYYKQYISGGE